MDEDEGLQKTKSIVNVFEFEEDINVMNQRNTFANLKMESPSIVGKPQLPLSWTQCCGTSSKKKKSPEMPKASTDFKRWGTTPAMDSIEATIGQIVKTLFHTL